MRKNDFIIWLGIAAAAGTGAGMLSDRKQPLRGGLLGATAGIVAGSVAAGFYHYVAAGDAIPYYSKSSPLYEEAETT
ncbi:MAG: hypothetical protein EPN25_03365 [Nitrospirae bacterium]|nr:MAG: hypothetical protein EPN25_03365 [Nitrospirota bacterium]